MFFKTIKFKLTLWYVVILAIILSSFSLFLYITLSDSLYKGLDNKIKTMAEVIASSIQRPLGGGPNIAEIDRIMRKQLGIRPFGRFIQVLDESGKVGGRSTKMRAGERLPSRRSRSWRITPCEW